MDGVGEALVFALKTSLQLKTEGCTAPYPGVDKVKVKVNIRRRLGEGTPCASVAKRKRRQGQGVT